jgi:hypothetical protein
MQITTRRRLVSGGAVALIATALSCGIATSAQAATGHINQGMRSLQLIPTAPATDFGTVGTAGVLSVNNGDGTAISSATLAVNDSATETYALPQGLKFDATACSQYTSNTTRSINCAISTDGRTLTVKVTNLIARALTYDFNAQNMTFPITSTGLVSGTASASLVPYPGMTSAAAKATGTVPGAVAPLTITGTSPADAAGNIPLNGKSEPGATITVKDSTGAVVATTTAGTDGKWTVTIPKGSKPALSITQTVGGVESLPVTYNEAPLPVLPALAGAGALVLAGFGGTMLRRRKRQTTSI